MVNADATAVDCTSAAFMVGAACGAQALAIKAIRKRRERNFACFMVWRLRDFLGGISAALGNNFVVLNNDLPVSLIDLEAPEYLEVFLAVHKCAGTVSPNRPAR
jgi:hypothetical protein